MLVSFVIQPHTTLNISCFVAFSAATARKPRLEEPEFITKLKPTDVVEGNNVRLKCRWTGRPTPEIQWYHNGDPVKDSRRVKVFSDDESSTLTITQATFDDEGEYKCVARNDSGSATCKAEVTVLEAPTRPEFTQNIQAVEATEGEETIIEVRLAGRPRPEVEWYKGSRQIFDGGRFSFDHDEDEEDLYSLVIRNTQQTDAGTYKCVAVNSEGRASCRGEVVVTEKLFAPRFVGDEEGPITVTEEDELNIAVDIKGNPRPEVEWHKDGELLTKSNNLDIRSRGDKYAVFIYVTKTSDSGLYQCVAKSNRGTASRTYEVNVECTFYYFFLSFCIFFQHFL